MNANSAELSNANITINDVEEISGNNDEFSSQLVVSTLEDENDGDFSVGDLSLREAIAIFNEEEGTGTITFEDSLSGGTITLSQGELSIEDSLTINGLGAENLTIDGNNNSRIFKVDDGNSETESEVAIDGVTISNGLVAEAPESNGGGILNAENLTISSSVITNNQTDSNEGLNDAKGGGIYTSGTLNLVDSVVSGNTGGTFGGGIYALSTTVNITDSSVGNNYSGFVGGGLYFQDTQFNLSNSTINGNEASFAFGGIAVEDSTGDITKTTVSDNIAQNGDSGGIHISYSEISISDSTISNNSALLMNAGGIDVGPDSAVEINNSTIANNFAAENGGGIVVGTTSTVNLKNSTVTGNSADNNGSGIYQSPTFSIGTPDGEIVIPAGVINLESTIVAGNVNNNDLAGEEINSEGNNLIGNGDEVALFNSSSGDLIGSSDEPIDPRLGELQDNGGVTPTIALLDDSPAIDAGSNPNNLATDQRGEGFDRTIGNGTDIGAYEVQTTSSDNEITGTADSDVLKGTRDGDRIFGLEGDDLIKGLNGDDFLDGGSGNDVIKGGKGSDSIDGGAGNDLIKGNSGNDLIKGGEGHDRILGGNGVDTIDDGAGDDVLFGGKGEDIFLASNTGNDTFKGGRGKDIYVYDINPDTGFFDRDQILDFNRHQDKVALHTSIDNFSVLDTNGSGVLDAHDDRVDIVHGSTVIDFSDFYGRSHNSDTITFVGVSDLDSDNFLFDETVVDTEFA